ncbi:MAG: translocation/assembly module TamB domain-containing protein [Microscillaceae bacterium]
MGLRGLWRLAKYTLLAGLTFILGLVILFHFAFFQTWAFGFFTQYLSQHTGFKVQAEWLYLDFYTPQLRVAGLQVHDPRGRTLLYADTVDIRFAYKTVLKNGDVFFEELRLKKANVSLTVDKKTETLNVTDFIEALEALFAKKNPDPNARPTIVHFARSRLQNCYFAYQDDRKPLEPRESIDFSHFAIDQLEGELENFRIVSDTIEAQIHHLAGKEQRTGLAIHRLQTFFRMTDTGMDFRRLWLALGKSVLRRNIYLKYKDKQDLSEFIDKVVMVADLDSSILHTEDLALFAPELRRFQDVWTVSGVLRGRVNDFNIKDLDLYWGQQSHVKGQIEMQGLPEISQTFLQIRLVEAKVKPQELDNYLDAPAVSEVLHRFGPMSFQAEFIGFINDFVAKGRFETQIGALESNLNLKLSPNPKQSYFKGTLSTRALHLGQMLATPSLGLLDMEGQIEGTGFSPESARLTLDAHLARLGFMGYEYHDLRADGQLSQQRFVGELLANDPNFDLSINGEMDFNPRALLPNTPPGRFKLEGDIRQLSLAPLGFSPVEMVLTGKLDIDTYGLSLDSLTGDIDLREAELVYNGRHLNIRDFDLLSFKTGAEGRYFQVSSDFFDFKADGNFTFSQVIGDLEELVAEYILIFQNHPEEIEAYYRQKNKNRLKEYLFHYEINLKNINPVLALFEDPEKVYVSRDVRLKGVFDQKATTILRLDAANPVDTLIYGSFKFYNTELHLNTVKLANQPSVFAEATISSKKQALAGTATENLLMDVTWGGALIDFTTKFKQANSNNRADLKGTIGFTQDTTLVRLQKANLQFLEENWKISPQNLININPLAIVFQDFVFTNQQYRQSQIAVAGLLSESLPEPLNVLVNEVELLPFADLIGRDIRGLLDATIRLESVYTTPEIEGAFNLENLLVDEVLIGDVSGDLLWENQENRLKILTEIYRKGKYILEMEGYYRPGQAQNSLDLVADFRQTDLKILEPFVSFLFSDLRGSATGRLRINGSLRDPQLRGKLTIPNGGLKINYLNTAYDLSGQVVFKPSEILTNDMKVFDEFSNPARLSMSLFHDAFQDIILDLKADFYNFELLNTSAEDNALFYGTAFGTGRLRVTGFLNRLNMQVTARSDRGTKISLPLDGYSEVSQQESIRFVSLSDRMRNQLPIEKVDLGGLSLNFNLDVNQNAEFEIIFDRKAGDIIRGSGKGLIDMNISEDGDLSLLGYYTIEQGKYNFTFANLVNKAFDIRPGSRITFNGDMFDTQLDVYALYKRNVPLSPLVDLDNVPDPESNEYRRPYEVAAILELDGKLLTPEIKLDLDLSEPKKTPNSTLQTAVYQLDSKIRTDDQERSRQVFSLLILNRLSPPNSFRGAGVAGTAGSSLSELLSNQFSNWISQVDENLELTLDVDANDLNTFQLRVSYSLLDGRLRITRDGGFTNSQNQADAMSVLGDITIEYLLSPGGKYRLKIYNRTNQNAIGNINLNNNNSTTTAGVSLVHTASFNRFREIFTSKDKKEERRKTDQLRRQKAKSPASPPEETAPTALESSRLLPEAERMPLPKRMAPATITRPTQPQKDLPDNLPDKPAQDRYPDPFPGPHRFGKMVSPETSQISP